MSGFFGIFNRNDNPVEPAVADAMLEAFSYWKPDERSVRLGGTVALGHAMLHNTPESFHEHLPLEQESLLLTMDARIDNRAELFEQLELPGRPTEEIGDSEFILAAYRKWGESCPQYLLGDFAFAIWDSAKNRLFCARDHMGVKPFYYAMDNDLFVFGNDMRGLLAHDGIPKALSDEAAAIYLEKGELWHPTLTFYNAVKKLPPATTLTVTTASATFHTYWDIETIRRDRSGTFDEYDIKLRALLEDAVKVRLRTQYPVASHLSGGLDSSTISVLAARMLARRGEKLKTYSWIAPPQAEDDASHYEWANSQQIASKENIDLEHIGLDGKALSEILSGLDISLNDTVDLWYEFVLRKSAHQQQIRTVLSGWGGDEFVTYHGRAIFADLVHQGKFLKALRGLWSECVTTHHQKRCFLRRCYREILLPFMPRNLLCYMPRVNCNVEEHLHCARDDFARYARKRKKPSTFMYQKSIPADQLAYYRQGHILARLESWSASAYENRLEYRFPLLDKRLIEFSLSLPEQYYYQKQQNRYLFRHAVQEILPEEIRLGNFKKEPKRVQQIIDTEMESFNYLLDIITRDEMCDCRNRYIHPERLRRSLIKLINSDFVFDYKTIETVNETVRTFLLGRAGFSVNLCYCFDKCQVERHRMTRNEKNDYDKKVWCKPQMKILDVKSTMGGNNPKNNESLTADHYLDVFGGASG
ncbi:asparagine synthase-related protein [Sulfurimonas sp. HSL-1656]|uniref:asparagine synthase-related protein n=1 Tax=Thiomicrolovo subterrani TaxID=3131934 RepID=UPI0031F81CC9